MVFRKSPNFGGKVSPATRSPLKTGVDEVSCDVLVVGSGAAGLTTAVTAALNGLKVILCEKTDKVGGATARSGGMLWIPGNLISPTNGTATERADALQYIAGATGNNYQGRRVERYLDEGPKMLDFIQANSELRFRPVDYPDYRPESAGAAERGRTVGAESFHAGGMGALRSIINPPLRSTIWMGLMVSPLEVERFLNAGRSMQAAIHVAKRFIRHTLDLAVHGQTMFLVGGNALVGRLLDTAVRNDVEVWTKAAATDLIYEQDGVRGATIRKDGRELVVRAQYGVILATGGFPHDKQRRETLIPWATDRPETWGVLPLTNTGDGARLAESVGGHVSNNVRYPFSMGPVAVRGDNKDVYPLFSVRAKPGMITVNRAGKRFANEGTSYHDFCADMVKDAGPGGPEAFVICDSRAIRRYGLGLAKPFPYPAWPYVRSGHLAKGRTLRALAKAIGIDGPELERTVERFNKHAANGQDPDFGRGQNIYNRMLGDRRVVPNPALAPLQTGPYYAVKILIGSLGTFAGVEVDEFARVSDGQGQHVTGLYAVGNDMASVFGDYLGGGITLGPGMTFGYVAAKHLADQARNRDLPTAGE